MNVIRSFIFSMVFMNFMQKSAKEFQKTLRDTQTVWNAKLTENIGKPKELWKALKNLGLPSKKSPSTNICLTKDNTTIFADKENTNIFKKFYSTLADDLVENLPPASSIFGLS